MESNTTNISKKQNLLHYVVTHGVDTIISVPQSATVVLVLHHPYFKNPGIYLVTGGYTTGNVSIITNWSGATVEKNGNTTVRVNTQQDTFLTVLGV